MKKGFTLIEMLGIITVLAVVLLVTFPALNQSLKTMQENKDNNTLKNLRVSAESYIELNRKNYPELDNANSATITIQELYDANLLKGQYANVNPSDKIIITKKTDGVLDYFYIDSTPKQEYIFSYTGGEQTFTAPQDGIYQIETWGAQGGSNQETSTSGYGGYSNGILNLSNNNELYINIGGKGQGGNNGNCNLDESICYGGYNGGGNSHFESDTKWGSGGGATHIALKSGLLSTLSGENDISKILIVSAGGGGEYSSSYLAGSAGGFIGNNGALRQGYTQATGGTQNNGGSGRFAGSFGMGGNCTSKNCSGGGAGFYGGGGTNVSSGAGGSSYIGNPLLTNKSMYCFDCKESNEVSTFTVSTTGDSELKDTTNCPDGYSENPVSKCAKAGNGYAKITYLGNEI